jgi:hypothetical protein
MPNVRLKQIGLLFFLRDYPRITPVQLLLCSRHYKPAEGDSV